MDTHKKLKNHWLISFLIFNIFAYTKLVLELVLLKRAPINMEMAICIFISLFFVFDVLTYYFVYKKNSIVWLILTMLASSYTPILSGVNIFRSLMTLFLDLKKAGLELRIPQFLVGRISYSPLLIIISVFYTIVFFLSIYYLISCYRLLKENFKIKYRG
jgi:hypothetical protein